MTTRKRFCLGSLSLVCFLAIALGGCSKIRHKAGSQPVDSCSLLTSDEIKSVQGEAVQNTKGSGNVGAEFIVSQCYFTTTTPVNSVVLTVTQKGTSGDGRSIKQFWKETFNDSEEAREKREKNREEEEHEGAKPERIEGVGEEAFWTGNRFGGALYVLKDEYHLRISIGGADDQATKIKKCKTLAGMILKRL